VVTGQKTNEGDMAMERDPRLTISASPASGHLFTGHGLPRVPRSFRQGKAFSKGTAKAGGSRAHKLPILYTQSDMPPPIAVMLPKKRSGTLEPYPNCTNLSSPFTRCGDCMSSASRLAFAWSNYCHWLPPRPPKMLCCSIGYLQHLAYSLLIGALLRG